MVINNIQKNGELNNKVIMKSLNMVKLNLLILKLNIEKNYQKFLKEFQLI